MHRPRRETRQTMTAPIYQYVWLAALLTIIPGADMALVTKNTLADGRRAAFFTTLGICAGLSVHAVASAFGLSAILRVSAAAYSGVKLAGAAYLVFLGIQSIRGTGKKVGDAAFSGNEASALRREHQALARSFRQGLLTNLLNPKFALFYLTILPQFIVPTDSALLKALLLAGVHIGMSLVWLTAYAYFLSGFRPVLSRPTVKRSLERVTGG